MKLRFPSRPVKTLAVLGGTVLAFSVIAFRAQADQWDKKTVITVDQPIQVENTYLEPGTYVFKLLNSSSNRNIVQIYNRDQNHLINTIMAINNYRLQPTDGSQFTFYETPRGTARAMHAWFYPGDNYGQEFRYPKELRTIALATKVETRQLEASRPPEPLFTKPVEPEPEAAPAPTTVTETPRQAEPVEIAQATPPPAPAPAPDVTPTPAPAAAEPAELPKTATPFPLIGLGGLISMAGYALMRLRG